MNTNLEKFKDVLKEIFQMDQAELDFGIYRIMNQKRTEIEQFLDNDLLPQVKEAFEKISANQSFELKKEIEKRKNDIVNLGYNPDENPIILQLNEELISYGNTASMENDVFSHLTNFFKRYYDNGDFISQRRYKKDVYAIPYEGEEVKLYWANYDQYYIKTTEYFNNYSFKISNGNKINFVVKTATTEQNNNIAAGSKERRFFIFDNEPVNIDNNILNINFNYDFNEEKQKDLNTKAFVKIKQYLNDNPSFMVQFNGLFDLRPTEKNIKRTLLEKHINDFTARNTFDYFIHKDLGGFLRRELDYYIKNEVLYIDDINELDENQLHKQVAIIKVLKHIGQKIIAFLEQLENFQKKLWLKKKFVIETNYCITVDRVPKELYAEIVNNKNQINEWIKLYAIDEIEGNTLYSAFTNPLTERFLEENQFLVLDTKFFGEEFKLKLLKSLNNLDDHTDGLLIHSENFQALNLLQKRYKEQVKCIYIDPPYNAKSSEILYKNTFKHSSWLSFLQGRLDISRNTLLDDGCTIIAIDENEQDRLSLLIEDLYNGYEKHCISIVHNPRGIMGSNFSYNNEFAFFIFQENKRIIREKKIVENDIELSNLRNWGTESERRDAKNCFYPIIIDKEKMEIVGFGEVCPDDYHPEFNVIDGKIVSIFPVDNRGVERKWRYARQSIEKIQKLLHIKKVDNKYDIQIGKDFALNKTVWCEKKYDANAFGSKLLNSILANNPFDFPKSLYTVIESIDITTDKKSIILDYFAGSGTTGHAVINLNREDGGNRKYILVEMGEYFNTVTKPRIQKVIYSKDWKDGKPVSREGSSHCFKYIRLESYEDTLNNLEIKKEAEQVEALLFEESFNEGYMLNYMLDVETEESASLLNINKFEDPFNYYLNITTNNEIKPQKIDLIETFNYLIGLIVDTIDDLDGFRYITGKNLNDEKILIIWRNTREKTNEDLNEFFTKIRVNIKDREYDLIYVNGDNYLQNLKLEEDKWKVNLIEEEFKKRMFE